MNVNDYNIYLERMRKSMKDKLWFVDILDNEKEYLVVDYGCSNGTLLNLLPNHWIKIGYDIDEEMIKKGHEINSNTLLFSNWNKIEQLLLENEDKTKVLILSSIIHEIYSYLDFKEVKEFWKRVFDSGFEYIVIRDMVPSNTIDRLPDINNVRNIYLNSNKYQIESFNNVWGKIDYSNKQLVHYLLKYKYIENWDKEVRENYFPIYYENLIYNIIPKKYKIEYIDHYILPYLKNIIKKDFDIDLIDKTHLKLLLKLKEGG